MTRQPQAQIYLPEDLLGPMQKILEQWQEIEKHTYDYQLHPVCTDFATQDLLDKQVFPLKGPYTVKPFQTFHRVSSCGYTVFENKKKLKKEFQKSDRETLLNAKANGINIHSQIEIPLISFTGDTRIDFWDSCPWIKKSKTLFMEVSFIDEQRTVEETRHWGHIHLDELLPLVEDFEGERIVLIHLSQRHSVQHLEEKLNQRLSKELRERVVVFPR